VRIPEANERRPDYKIYTNGTRIIAEIKQIDPNEAEKGLEKRQRKGEVVIFGATPGERIRRALRAANPQLKPLPTSTAWRHSRFFATRRLTDSSTNAFGTAPLSAARTTVS
jgi:hypothetical protein